MRFDKGTVSRTVMFIAAGVVVGTALLSYTVYAVLKRGKAKEVAVVAEPKPESKALTFEVPKADLLVIAGKEWADSAGSRKVMMFEDEISDIFFSNAGTVNVVYFKLANEPGKSFVSSIWEGTSILDEVKKNWNVSIAAVPSGRRGEYIVLICTALPSRPMNVSLPAAVQNLQPGQGVLVRPAVPVQPAGSSTQ